MTLVLWVSVFVIAYTATKPKRLTVSHKTVAKYSTVAIPFGPHLASEKNSPLCTYISTRKRVARDPWGQC